MTTEARGGYNISMTPLEQKIVDEFKQRLVQESVSESIIEVVVAGFGGDKLPTADVLAALIKEHSGGPSA
jgi:hypothetical protein